MYACFPQEVVVKEVVRKYFTQKQYINSTNLKIINFIKIILLIISPTSTDFLSSTTQSPHSMKPLTNSTT